MDQAHDRISDIVESADVAMFTTSGAGGALHARPLAALQDGFDGTLRFLVEDPSPKVAEIAAAPGRPGAAGPDPRVAGAGPAGARRLTWRRGDGQRQQNGATGWGRWLGDLDSNQD